mmetsp:Transcript_45586/g.138527  ORF Transcript_45586/g.138527 Transcript_45586/m.138527 type:complete len:409 (+) Transcript_45586:746-1972(+)
MHSPQLIGLRLRSPLQVHPMGHAEVVRRPILVAPLKEVFARPLAAEGLVLQESVPPRRGYGGLVALLGLGSGRVPPPAARRPQGGPLGIEHLGHVDAIDVPLLHEADDLLCGGRGPSRPLSTRDSAVGPSRHGECREALEEDDPAQREDSLQPLLQRRALGVHPPRQVVIPEVVGRPHAIHFRRVVDAEIAPVSPLPQRGFVPYGLPVHRRGIVRLPDQALHELPRHPHEDHDEVVVVILHLRHVPAEVGVREVQPPAGVEAEAAVLVEAEPRLLDLARDHPDAVRVQQWLHAQVLVAQPVVDEGVNAEERLGLEVSGAGALHDGEREPAELVAGFRVAEDGRLDDGVGREGVGGVGADAVLYGVAEHAEDREWIQVRADEERAVGEHIHHCHRHPLGLVFHVGQVVE